MSWIRVYCYLIRVGLGLAITDQPNQVAAFGGRDSWSSKSDNWKGESFSESQVNKARTLHSYGLWLWSSLGLDYWRPNRSGCRGSKGWLAGNPTLTSVFLIDIHLIYLNKPISGLNETTCRRWWSYISRSLWRKATTNKWISCCCECYVFEVPFCHQSHAHFVKSARKTQE